MPSKSKLAFGDLQFSTGVLPPTSGSYFFVSSRVGSNGNVGDKPERAFATIAKAVTACTASAGDVIVCLPGHTEVVTAAGTIDVSKAGVTILGVGYGRQRPVITYTTATAASFNITAANVRVENVVFSGVGFDAITAMVNVSAADAQFINCEFETGNATNQATLGILTTAAADRLLVDGCHFHGSADAGTATAIRVVGGDSARIVNSVFVGNYTTTLGAIDNATTACTNAAVINNRIFNRTASSTKAMTFQAGSTGQIARNDLQILSGTAPITGAAMSWVGGNYYAATIATAGTLI